MFKAKDRTVKSLIKSKLEKWAAVADPILTPDFLQQVCTVISISPFDMLLQ
jgi:hypothetical protein